MPSWNFYLYFMQYYKTYLIEHGHFFSMNDYPQKTQRVQSRNFIFNSGNFFKPIIIVVSLLLWMTGKKLTLSGRSDGRHERNGTEQDGIGSRNRNRNWNRLVRLSFQTDHKIILIPANLAFHAHYPTLNWVPLSKFFPAPGQEFSQEQLGILN